MLIGRERMSIEGLFRVLLICVFAVLPHYQTSAARILCVFQVPAKSHRILGASLAKALVRAGHEVTMASPFVSDEPLENYRDIELEDINEYLRQLLNETRSTSMFDKTSETHIQSTIRLHVIGVLMTDVTLNDPNFQRLLRSDESFDAVIIEGFFNDALHALGVRFNAPVIVLSTIGPNFWVNVLVGNPEPYSHIPEIFTDFTDRMSFSERLLNTIGHIGIKITRLVYYIPKQNGIVQKYFRGYPDVNTLMLNTSLVLLNSHVSFAYAQPLVPNMIEIGGFHVDKPKPLPADLQNFLDDAKEGVVYFSMGSNLRSNELPTEKLNALLSTFSRLKLKVLWKWEAETMPGKPDNLKLSPWLPQQDILAHPNVKMFITHGGLLSTLEAIDRGVPLIGIPIFGDQSLNMKRAMNLGYGLMIKYDNLTEESLSWAINEILNNPKYRENVKHRSAVLHDQQIDPIKKALWWIDYVIRHKGAKHLRSSAADMPLYQYCLVDVVLCIAVIVTIVTIIPCYLIVKICRRKTYTNIEQIDKKNNKKKN